MNKEIDALLQKGWSFQPKPVYSADGDFISLFIRDSDCKAERIDDTVTIYKDVDSGELVGCKIKGYSTLLERLDSSGVVVQDEFTMLALFMGWAAMTKIQPQDVEILHYLVDQFGCVTVTRSADALTEGEFADSDEHYV